MLYRKIVASFALISTGYVVHLFYAQFNENFVGFATVSKKAHSLMIDHLYVEPAFRHQHIGTKLVTSIFETFPDQDIYTSVYAFNADALQFYQALLKRAP